MPSPSPGRGKSPFPGWKRPAESKEIMDIWFSLFVALVGIIVAVGISLVMVGYINLMPSSLAAERKWRIWVAGVPMGLVFIPVAVVCIISPFVEMMPWEDVARWLSIPAVTIHLIATLAS